jgi:hypothetical protein
MVLYKRKEDVSRYPETIRAKRIVPGKHYDLSRDDLMLVWMNYDASISFFDNYALLYGRIPLPSRMVYVNAENCDYAEAAWMSKSVYLSILAIGDCENILYTFYTQDNVKNVLNSVMVWDNSESIYFSTAIIQSYQVFYSKYVVNSSNIWFSANMVGCRECIGCHNLENKEYCIENVQLTKDEYIQRKNEILRNKHIFLEKYLSIRDKWENIGSKDVQWEFCIYSENVENGYFGYRVKNAKNILFVWDKDGRKNVYDTLCSDQKWEGDLYWCINLWPGSNCYFSDCFIGHSLYYCFNCIECSFCLWCIGLKNKSYCILNKQYTKEEWEILAEKIFASMEADGTLGDFFPAELNPFYFNDTMAYLVDDSFTKEEIETAWYLWRDEPIRADIPEWMKVVKNTELDQFQGFRKTPFGKGDVTEWQGDFSPEIISEKNPQSRRTSSTAPLQKELTWYIDPEILNVVISDEKWNYYRIVKMEYDFLMKHELPLPTMHWLDRMRTW